MAMVSRNSSSEYPDGYTSSEYADGKSFSFRYLFSLGIFPRTVSSEISEEIPTKSPRKCFFGMSSESFILGIPSYSLGISEEILLSDDHFRRYVLGIPLFRGHTDDICRRNAGVFL
ncbi:hypothetical protein F2Q69_00009362 [Brassica cretica]|uniref:Uncharacterized protein n=1 Tax=Brassica cretica TaxID=69181 RepID=A0A8S9NVB7_BRACR|nr:hypothetical protein F2Q69_00009362 [Brassica cretica]